MGLYMKNRVKSLINFPTSQGYLEECLGAANFSDDVSTIISSVLAAYRIAKDVAPMYYRGNDKMGFSYEMLRKKLIFCEENLVPFYITDTDVELKMKDSRYYNKKIDDFKSPEEKTRYIVWLARRDIVRLVNKQTIPVKVSINQIDLTNFCERVSRRIKIICEELGIKCKMIKIPAAFSERIELYGGDGFHYFNLIIIDGVKYLVDCTYKQFFKYDTNLLDRLGIVKFNGCTPGVYMMLNESRKKTAQDILNNGYVEATKENLKNYLDGFTLSFRNGLYYEEVGVNNYDVSYTLSDYEGFLRQEDDLFSHENLEHLGLQKRPLNNSNFNFNIK